MEHRALANLFIRMAGLFLVILGVTAIPRAVSPFFGPVYGEKIEPSLLVVVALLNVGIPLLTGMFLIYFPSVATTKVLRIENVEPQNPAESSLLEGVAFSLLGLWFSVTAITDGVRALSTWHLYRVFVEGQHFGDIGPPIRVQEFTYLTTAAIQLAIGLWLLFGNRGLARALARLRGQSVLNQQD